MNILTISDLTIGYKTKVIAKALNAELKRGKLTCLVGRNGVGKSTLLRTLAAFQPALGGSISIGGMDTARMSRRELAAQVSVVLTGRPDLQQMTVREIVAMGRSPYTDMWGTLRDEDKAIVEDSICRAGIQPLAERSIETLSDGECQKAMIAKALAQQTPIILLDEPTAFLDYPSKVETMRLMKTVSPDGGVLMSTHDMEMALHLADELWVMTTAHELITGTPQQLEKTLHKEGLCFSEFA